MTDTIFTIEEAFRPLNDAEKKGASKELFLEGDMSLLQWPVKYLL